MKRLMIGLMVVVVSLACNANKAEEGKSQDGKKSALPKGLLVNFNPDTRVINAGGTLKIAIDNKTGTPYTYVWSSPQNCGELKVKDETAVDASFIGGVSDSDCSDELKLTVKGAESVLEETFTVKVEAGEAAAELELRPNPVPGTWLLVNDYEKTLEDQMFTCTREAKEGEEQGEEVTEEVKLNLLEATFGMWQYEGAACMFESAPEGETGVVAMKYDLPYDDAFCGMYENLGLGENCETEPMDLGLYDSLTFLAKSGDAEPHQVFVEVVQWEKYAEFHQGKASEYGPIKIPADKWKRFVITVPELCDDDVLPHAIKSVSFKVKRKGHPDKGLILFDNVAFIKKADEAE